MALAPEDAPLVKMRFTRCSELSYGACFVRDDFGQIVTHAQDCEFHGAAFGGWVITVALTNCLLDRCGIVLNGGIAPNQITLQNCTMRGSILSIDRWPEYWGSPGTGLVPVTIVNCAFDGTTISTEDAQWESPELTYYNFNRFLEGATPTVPSGSDDGTVGAFNWQSSWLGCFYLPSDSPLKDAGNVSDAAQVGLYHYTTQTNFENGLQVKEANSQVDIGYHYVAVDESGNPIDSDSDGVADYLEDANGNSLVDSGETDWQSAVDLGLKVLITQPKRTSNLP